MNTFNLILVIVVIVQTLYILYLRYSRGQLGRGIAGTLNQVIDANKTMTKENKEIKVKIDEIKHKNYNSVSDLINDLP